MACKLPPLNFDDCFDSKRANMDVEPDGKLDYSIEVGPSSIGTSITEMENTGKYLLLQKIKYHNYNYEVPFELETKINNYIKEWIENNVSFAYINNLLINSKDKTKCWEKYIAYYFDKK